MSSASDLKTIHERNLRALRLRPSIGRGTATTVARVRSGSVTCDIEDGEWKLIGDEAPGDGGAGVGPDPGVYARSALASCIAIGYLYWAALLDVTLDRVEVKVEADYDASGFYGIDEAKDPGFSAVRYYVDIASSAPEEKVREIVEKADRFSSILDVFKRPVPVTRELRIAAPVAD